MYACKMGKLNCFMYSVQHGVISFLKGAIFDVLGNSRLSTVSPLNLGNQKDKTKVKELHYRTKSSVYNQIPWKLAEDGDYRQSLGLILGNKMPHCISYSGILKNLMPSNGTRPCMHAGWTTCLKDVLSSFSTDQLWVETLCSKLPSKMEMGQMLVAIILRVTDSLVGFKEQGLYIKRIDAEKIVFHEYDKNYRYPELKDCEIWTDDESQDTGFESLAELIESIKGFIPGRMGPNINSFLKCLRGNSVFSSYCKKMMDEKKWRHLLAHPNFMDPQEKVDNLVAIRYNLRGSMGKNCKITMAELGWNQWQPQFLTGNISLQKLLLQIASVHTFMMHVLGK
ncbi:uncharacterized protein LOC113346022 [Papaver somniferum]|uniref:uncharacterized protein LOC113335379 n=1 Tax=Papaver somniferum TaxID=3469 RepID=UPI000E70455A|nr:uncharacterized protein LOC113335379 [Papaver somniferum]XP_026445422.1 uncharacterized protein LOC113346022 [Papaver somniferum]